MTTLTSLAGFGPLIRPYLPVADVYVADGTHVIELDLPGYEKDELTIGLAGCLLTVAAKDFDRTFLLPLEADNERITWTFASRVLKVLVPLRNVPVTRDAYPG